ncbi:hypothetical protein SprV_0802586800 [Sparganum proliferum]
MLVDREDRVNITRTPQTPHRNLQIDPETPCSGMAGLEISSEDCSRIYGANGIAAAKVNRATRESQILNTKTSNKMPPSSCQRTFCVRIGLTEQLRIQCTITQDPLFLFQKSPPSPIPKTSNSCENTPDTHYRSPHDQYGLDRNLPHCDCTFTSRIYLVDHLRTQRDRAGEPMPGAPTCIRVNFPGTFSHRVGLLSHMHPRGVLRQSTAVKTPSRHSRNPTHTQTTNKLAPPYPPPE